MNTWGIFKLTHNGEGIYWNGSVNAYNVEGLGVFVSMQAAKEWINARAARRAQAELDQNKALVAAGAAVRATRCGETVTLFPPGAPLMILTIREYRQRVFDLQDQWGKEIVFV